MNPNAPPRNKLRSATQNLRSRWTALTMTCTHIKIANKKPRWPCW